jgi:CCR4-NOT transcription complex subunit 1
VHFRFATRLPLTCSADAILSANFSQFINILAHPGPNNHDDLTPSFVATIVDRFIQHHPPNFNEKLQGDLLLSIGIRYSSADYELPPIEVLAAIYLREILSEKNPFALYIQRIGLPFTTDEDACSKYLRSISGIRIDEEQVAAALLYTAISTSAKFSPSVFVSALRKSVPKAFRWQQVISQFDQKDLRISKEQFLVLYNALRPLAESSNDENINIQLMWGGRWKHSETQLSFITAYASQSPEGLDASTIPGLQRSFTMEMFEKSSPIIQEHAKRAVKHPLVSAAALLAVFYVALPSSAASETPEARRLFQEVVISNLDIFLVSAFGVPKPWPELANETINSLFDRFLYKIDPTHEFVLYSLWFQDKSWVVQRLVDAHARNPLELPTILEHAVRHGWLNELVMMLSGFGLDLAALAHANDKLDLDEWQQLHSAYYPELFDMLLTFLSIKADHELTFQRAEQQQLFSVMLPVKTISALLNILTNIAPASRSGDSNAVQRQCITAYPRLINYGEGFDEIIDANGRERNSLPKEANDKMEEHYKRMYNDEVKVVAVLEALGSYKRSTDSMDQDVFACMIHGLFDEYSLYSTYPLEALKTTALLFGGVICYKLLPLLPLEIGLSMILDAIKNHSPEEPMYKFGLEALKQTLSLFPEWPGLCLQLIQIPGLKGTDAYAKAEEVTREHNAEITRNGNGNNAMAHNEITNGDGGNGNFEMTSNPSLPPFKSLNVEPSRFGQVYQEPSEDTQEKVLFVLNNITERNFDSKFKELSEAMEHRYQQWFAEHLVEERAKMQPNYHQLYLNLIKHFEDKSLWVEVARETYNSVARMLNAEATMQSSTERAHLKNLGGWLGSLTLARDKPIKHRNIAFKQLLMEAFESQRLIVVLPFVCRVLQEGAKSTIFKPPNPWLMDILYLLIELYHHGDLKLNLKFEIEVLCASLELDYKNIQPSTEIQERLSASTVIEEPFESRGPMDGLDRLENLSLNGMASVGSGRFSPHQIITSIPDLGPLLTYPPMNDMVDQDRLQVIVKTAITRAVHEIISPVVERSVTIAAISTAQMIHKDFVTEPDENRVRSAAINMVKRTAGSLALVTSKEPLRASMTNYIRTMSAEMPPGLPEGTIIMCVNSNLDMACSQVEKKAEERAVPEIEEMIEPELEARRRHRAMHPTQPYQDAVLSRWAMTIPAPYKLMPSTTGLNQDQMAIYDEFARQPRVATTLSGLAHGPSSSDATRSMANDILQDQYASIPSLPTPAENPVLPRINSQHQPYSQPAQPITNGRLPPQQLDPNSFFRTMDDLLENLLIVVSGATEDHFRDVPRHVLKAVDDVFGLIIKFRSASSGSEEFVRYTAEQVCAKLFAKLDNSLAAECLVTVLDQLSKFSQLASRRVVMLIASQPDETLLNVPLVMALVNQGLLDWQRIDSAAAKGLQQRQETALEFLSTLMHKVLLIDRPVTLRTDFARSLEALYQWRIQEPELEAVEQLSHDLTTHGLPPSINRDADAHLENRKDQIEYLFSEWMNLCGNVDGSQLDYFVDQLRKKQIFNDPESSCLFLRACIDESVDLYEIKIHNTGRLADGFAPIDALAKLIVYLVKHQSQRVGEEKTNKAAYLESILSLVVLIFNYHYVTRAESLNQKVWSRLFSSLLCEFDSFDDDLSLSDQEDVIQVFGETLLALEPSRYPGFVFSWVNLVSHRDFMPKLLLLQSQSGWAIFSDLLESLLLFLGEQLKALQTSPWTREIYQGTIKLLLVMHHDFPEFLASNHIRLCAAVPTPCIQIRNLILTATPSAFTKLPDPLQTGLKMDRIEENHEIPIIKYDVELPLREAGLLDLIDQALQSGPSEDAVAHIAHAIHRNSGTETTIGYVPIKVDSRLIEAIVLYVGMHSIAKAARKRGPVFAQASPDAALLTMLLHELSGEAKFYFLNSVINQLRFANAHTHYFSQALLEVFGSDLNDPEESEIRQQIVRIILERSIGHWPQPWGVIVTVAELLKNKKFMFHELDFIKSAPEVCMLSS